MIKFLILLTLVENLPEVKAFNGGYFMTEEITATLAAYSLNFNDN